MRQGDFKALASWGQMEEAANCGGLEPSRSARDRYAQVDAISHLWSGFHERMPYIEAERQWLFENFDFRDEANGRESDWGQWLNENDARFVSGGIHRVVAGRMFLPRWVSWRRQTDEFEGQGTVKEAREYLTTLLRRVELSR
jgi:hypothetical protein